MKIVAPRCGKSGCIRGSVLRQSDSKGVICLDHSGFGVGLSKKCLIWTYVQKGNVPFVILLARMVWEMRWSPSKNCFAQISVCGHIPVRKQADVPGVKSGLCPRGVMGPRIDDNLYLLQASRKEVSGGCISGWFLQIQGS